MQQDIRETERKADTNGSTHTSLALLAGEGCSNKREYKSSKGRGKTLVVFHLEGTDTTGSSFVLSFDKFAESGQRHRFLLVVDIEEIAGLHLNGGIYLYARLDNLAQALELADVVLLKGPVVFIIGQSVVLNRCGLQTSGRADLLASWFPAGRKNLHPIL